VLKSSPMIGKIKVKEEECKMMETPQIGDFVTDVYGHKGVVASVYFDYVRLTDGKHVYKRAISKIVKE